MCWKTITIINENARNITHKNYDFTVIVHGFKTSSIKFKRKKLVENFENRLLRRKHRLKRKAGEKRISHLAD
jgi:hypothetical protein